MGRRISVLGALVAVVAGLCAAAAPAWAVGEVTPRAGIGGCFSLNGSDGIGGSCTTLAQLPKPGVRAISPNGLSVYAINRDASPSLGHALAVLDRDPVTGALTQKAGQAGCFSHDGENGSGDGDCTVWRGPEVPMDVEVSPDGEHVYVAGYSNDRKVGGVEKSDSIIAVLDRDPATGALTQSPTAAGCVVDADTSSTCGHVAELSELPRRMVFSPGGAELYVLMESKERVTPELEDGVATLHRNATTGALTQAPDGCITADAPGGICHTGNGLVNLYDIAISPDGKTVYVASSDERAGGQGGGPGTIAILDRHATTGELSQDTGLGGCLSQNGDGRGEGSKTQMDPNPECTVVAGMYKPEALLVSPDSEQLYAALYSVHAIMIFDRESDGDLARRPGAAGCVGQGVPVLGASCTSPTAAYGPFGLALSADGRTLYVTDEETLKIVDRDPETGALAAKAGFDHCVSRDGIDSGSTTTLPDQDCVKDGRIDPGTVTVAPGDEHVYIGALNGILLYDRAADDGGGGGTDPGPSPDPGSGPNPDPTGSGGPPGGGNTNPISEPSATPLPRANFYALNSVGNSRTLWNSKAGSTYILIASDFEGTLGTAADGHWKPYVPKPGGKSPTVTVSKARRIKVTPRSFVLPPHGSKKVKLKFPRAMRKVVVKNRRRALVTLRLTFTGPLGDRVTRTETVLVKPPKRRNR